MKKDIIEVALVSSRHDMPVEEAIFDYVQNPNDFGFLEWYADQWIRRHCSISIHAHEMPKNALMMDCYVYKSNVELRVYVTGLSSALAAVIKSCVMHGVGLTLMHYDKDSGDYLPQKMW